MSNMRMSKSAFDNMMRNNPQSEPPRNSWSQSGRIFCQQQNPTVTCQACFPKPGIYTVQFEISDIIQAAGQSGQLTFADIVWSVNGTNVKRTVSVISGTTVTGVGDAVFVRVYDGSPPGSEVGVAGVAYTATINISPGLRPAQSQQPYYDIPNPDATLTGFYGKCAFPVTAASSLQVFFPQTTGLPWFSGTAYSTGGSPRSIGATSIHVAVGSEDGTAIPDQGAQVEINNIGRIYDPRQSPQWHPIPPGAYAVTLFNRSVGSTYVFSVTLGIDG